MRALSVSQPPRNAAAVEPFHPHSIARSNRVALQKTVTPASLKAVEPSGYQIPSTPTVRPLTPDPRRKKLKELLWLRSKIENDELCRWQLENRRVLFFATDDAVCVGDTRFDVELPGLRKQDADWLRALGERMSREIVRIDTFVLTNPNEIAKQGDRLVVPTTAPPTVFRAVEEWQHCPRLIALLEQKHRREFPVVSLSAATNCKEATTANASQSTASEVVKLNDVRPTQPDVGPTPDLAPQDAQPQPRSSEPRRIDPAQLELMRRQQEAQFGR